VAKRIAIVLVILLAILAGVFAFIDIGHSLVFIQTILVALSNAFFISFILILITIVASRTYLRTGMHQILWLGAGSLAFSLGSLLSAFQIRYDLNLSMAVYDTGALLAGIFYLHGLFRWTDNIAASATKSRSKLNILLIYYLCVFLLLLAFNLLEYFKIIPDFFVPGTGPTVLNNIIMGIASTLLVISFSVYIVSYYRNRIDFYFWYALALLLMAGGLVLIDLAPAGSPLAWLGHISNWIGGIYFIPAIIDTVKQARKKGVDIEEIVAGFFRDPRANYELLVEESADAILSTDKAGRIILWNPAAEKIFGYNSGEAVGTYIWDLLTEESAGYLKNELIRLTEAREQVVTDESKELEARRKNGEIFPTAVSYSARKVPVGWITIIIVRDITELKRARIALLQANEELEIRVKQRTAELEISNSELRSLTSKLALSEERERKRIATELHDNVGQVLAVCNLRLASTLDQAPSNLKDRLEELSGMVQKLNDETNSLMFQLSPPVLYDLGLEPAIEELAIWFQQQNDIPINVEWDGQTKPLGIELRIILFQTVRELLMNVIEHAEATQVDISIRQKASQLIILFKDNGIGFDPHFVGINNRKGGSGLLQIRERIRNIGGQFEIESQKGQGARVSIQVPMQR
jgi:PAS domain S-box-containing protein